MTLKMAVVAPIPRAKAATARTVEMRSLRRPRAAERKSSHSSLILEIYAISGNWVREKKRRVMAQLSSGQFGRDMMAPGRTSAMKSGNVAAWRTYLRQTDAA